MKMRLRPLQTLGKSPISLQEPPSHTVLKLWQGQHTVNHYELSPSNNFKSCGVVIPRRSSKRRSYRCRNSGEPAHPWPVR